VRSPHVEAAWHLQLRPGTNVALINAMAHVIVTEGLVDEAFVRERCDMHVRALARFIAGRGALAGGHRIDHRRAGCRACAPPRLYASGGNSAIYYGLGVTEHSQGSTMVMGMANLAMAAGSIGREGSASTRCGAEQRAGRL
jgi:formate dehydrogenase major subunit